MPRYFVAISVISIAARGDTNEDTAMGVFFDVGSAWFADDAQNSFDRLDYLVSQPPRIEEDLDLKKSFGFGIKLGDSRLNIARALGGDGQGGEFSARFGRALYLLLPGSL